MRLDYDTTRDVLADAWERWARRCAQLTPQQWSAPTRCKPWDVHALTAHVNPDPAMFDMIEGATTDGPPVVNDAADLLRRFNAPDGVAHTMADEVADTAMADARKLAPDVIVERFTACAGIVRGLRLGGETVVRYPVVGSVTLAVLAEVALMEATVHLLDFADAVGGVAPSPVALGATRDLLIAIPEPTAAVEALAGRAPASVAVPAIR